MCDKLSDSDSDTAINNICTRKKAISIAVGKMYLAHFNINFSSAILVLLFFSPDLVDFIVDKTNNYWARTVNDDMRNIKIGRTVDELYCFLTCTLLMLRNKKLRLSEYWSRDKLLQTDIFSEIMCRDRYLVLLKMLHFVENNLKSSDRLQKISSVSSRLKKSFKNSFHPFQNLCIDESLLLYKGRLSFKQYIPAKRSRFDIKTYVLCNCKTGYVLDTIVYTVFLKNLLQKMRVKNKISDLNEDCNDEIQIEIQLQRTRRYVQLPYDSKDMKNNSNSHIENFGDYLNGE
ncbi:piggyBac transposable element-derived protein 4-like [Vespa mandarinia]|uniref:piggyBac transposable element-derived protein 4-like n=1 Tax=Vespa mandarinia TaxID=7446 RepID=UPI00161E6F0C|nr:piggyBac transposable element-derived protein 4-like [Vespa mandarinia]